VKSLDPGIGRLFDSSGLLIPLLAVELGLLLQRTSSDVQALPVVAADLLRLIFQYFCLLIQRCRLSFRAVRKRRRLLIRGRPGFGRPAVVLAIASKPQIGLLWSRKEARAPNHLATDASLERIE
jgi:hypothetical protein